MTTLEWTPELLRILEIMEKTKESLFLTGRAGTGKSTLLTHFRSRTQKKTVILAPTGVAALNVKGETIHSFFRFGTTVTPESALRAASKIKKTDLYEAIETLIIDEISMVRADLFDCVDIFLRTVCKTTEPFGGKQVILIGDLMQLPPIITRDEKQYFDDLYDTPYFFSSHVMNNPLFDCKKIEMERVFRQQDPLFIECLTHIRNNTLTQHNLKVFNQKCYNPTFKWKEGFVLLTTTNQKAEVFNRKKLETLDGETFSKQAKLSKEFESKYAPAELEVQFKIGAQVMFLNNDSSFRWVNGSIGTICAIDQDSEVAVIEVELKTGTHVYVTTHTWELYKYKFDTEKKTVAQEKIGEFTQYPLKLAWAMTIHKSQGKTFDKVMIDLSAGAFASGQTYVALSRCRSLEGLVLTYPLKGSHIFVDERVKEFIDNK
ncbi:MAG: AAA family ATPase [Candidatus Margulisbacteria bacterium]|nr:AAA family ATPase [Candidatus Margulisiibacteriota bacterium]